MSSICISASPIAVPSRGRQPVEWPRRSSRRSAVGSTSVPAAPTRTRRGRRGCPRQLVDEGLSAAPAAASRRVGETSVAGIEPETSMARMHRRVLARRRRRPSSGGRAPMSSAGDRGEVEGRRQVAAPRRAARREVGEQVEVREADRVAASGGAGPRGRSRAATGTRRRPSRSIGARGRSCESSSVVGRGRCAKRGQPGPVGGESEMADAEPAELRSRARRGPPRRPRRTRLRSRRSPVSTRSVRPDLGVDRASARRRRRARPRGGRRPRRR